MTRISAVSVGIVALLAVGATGGTIAIANSFDEPCVPLGQSGSASQLVTVTDGEVGQPPVMDFPTPLVTTGTEREILREGSGVAAVEGSAVDFMAAAYLGSGGEFLTATSFVEGESIRRVVSNEDEDFFGRALKCAQSGSRIVLTEDFQTVFGPVPEDDFVQNDSTVVVVLDVTQVYPVKASGIRQGLLDGAPTVVQRADGRHGISIPMGAPPQDLIVHTTIRGEGPTVNEGDRIVAHYTAAVWETKQVFSNSFDQGAPVSIDVLNRYNEASGAGVVEGIFEGLKGQTVGSQVVIVVPPGVGHNDGGQPAGVPEGSTLVYVFDILGVQGATPMP